MQNKRRRLDEVIETIESALSYRFLKSAENRSSFKLTKEYASDAYFNNGKNPYVVIDKNGNIQEVILPNKSNNTYLKRGVTIVENGRRFKATTGVEQQGLRILEQAFGDLPVIVRSDGSIKRFDLQELRFINRDFKLMEREIILERNKHGQKRSRE